MKFLFLSLFIFAIIFSLSQADTSSSSSGESKEQKQRRDSCGGLVEEPPAPSTASPTPAGSSPSPTGSSEETGDFHSKCILVQAFYNFSLTLTVQQQVIWEAWIQEIENTVLANVSLSGDEKVLLISLSLKAFCSVNIDIYQKISYLEIADWGYVIDFMYVSINIQIEKTSSIVVSDSQGNCELTESISEEVENCGCDADDKSALQNLVVEIKAILIESLSYEARLSAIFELIQSFCSEHPDLESTLLSINIQGYGSLQSFVDVCQTYHRITTVSIVLSGSSTSDCLLLEALQEASTNTSFTPEQRGQIVQLLNKLQVAFQVNLTISQRLKIVSTTCYQMFKLESWMIEIVESIMCGEWGSIYDIIFCSGICTNDGCGDLDNPSGTTTALPATTVQPANCNTIGNLIVVDSNNQTVLTNVLTEAYNSWNSSTKLGFNSCFNKIRQAIWNNAAFPTQGSKFTELHTDFLQYNNNSVWKQQVVFNLTITIWSGTIGQFVQCCGSLGN